jgi:hypothetical protein
MSDPMGIPADPSATDLAMMLLVLSQHLHPIYGNTSYRGRGIGGSAITQQCSVIHPEGWEIGALQEIDEVLHAYFINHPEIHEQMVAKLKEMKECKA